MGINVLRIGVYVWKFLKLSFITSYRFFRKDPYVGVILVLVLLLYVFLPFYFIILVGFSPLIVLVAVSIRVYLKYKRAKFQNVNKVEKKASEERSGRPLSLRDGVIKLRHHGIIISRQMSRRTNFKDRKKVDLDRQGGAGKEDDMVALTANTMELLGLTSQNEYKPKVILDASGFVDHGEGCASEKVIVSESWPRPDFTSHSGSDKQSQKYDGNRWEAESVEEGDEDDDEEEEGEEYRNKVLEWTKDDQKNLMDLGISEIARNNRLETLIAKRRAKAEGDIGQTDTDKDGNFSSEMEIAPIAVSTTDSSKTPHSKGLPGSAPPILLPSRSPFDLPYDPLEEKPNLMGGNFHEEFKATKPKEFVFRKYESFTLGTSSSALRKQDKKESVFGPYFGTIGNPGFQRQPKKGDHGQLDEKLFSPEGESISQHLKKLDLAQGDRAPNEEINYDHQIQDKKNQVAKDVGDSGASKLSLECLEAEQLIETLRVHPSLALANKNDPENLESIDDRDDETNSENSSDNSEKQSEHDGAAYTQETTQGRGKVNSIVEENQNTIELGSSGTDQSSNDHNESSLRPQHKRHADHLLHDVDAMEKNDSSNAKPTEKDMIPSSSDTSDQKNSQESGNLSFTEENINTGKVNELDEKAETDRNLESIEDAEGDPPISAGQEQNDLLLKSSAAASNMLQIVNESLMSEIMNEEKNKSFKPGEVVSQLSTMEDPVQELATTLDKSELKSTRDNEAEDNDSSESNSRSTRDNATESKHGSEGVDK